MTATNFDKSAVEEIYARWAPVYDFVFGAVFERGRRAVVAAAERMGGHVLEVGVGTGLSLPYYTGATRVTGIDLSPEMLSKAHAKVRAGQLSFVDNLTLMDAEKLEFPDASFEVVTAQCVVNTVPHPEAALDEFLRVLKPGGEIILLNRVGADGGARLTFERIFQPIASRLGWRSDFPWVRFEKWLERHPGKVQLLERRPVPPFGHFSLIRFSKPAASSPAAEPAAALAAHF